MAKQPETSYKNQNYIEKNLDERQVLNSSNWSEGFIHTSGTTSFCYIFFGATKPWTR